MATKTSANTLRIMSSSVHYWVYNPSKRRTIVMVHGFRGNHYGLQDIISQLSEFRIIIPDLPGFGESTPMDHPHDIAGYSEFVTKFIQKLGLHQPALLGHSFGSIVAASVAAAQPQLISKLILINPIASLGLDGPRAILGLGPRLYYWIGGILPEKAGRAFLSSRLFVRITSNVLTKTNNKALRADIHRHHLQHFSSFQTRQALLEAFYASTAHTATEYAKHITTPTLLIAGAIDDIAPLTGQYELERRLPGARLVVVPRVGHLIHREAPQQAAQEITRFLMQ